MTRNGQVAILGAGVMGETLLSGLLRAGRRPGELLITERREERAAELRERYGVDVVTNLDAATKADTLVLVVKPQDMADLLAEIAPAVRAEQTVVSLAAGITTGFIESRLPAGVAVVRVMPNTPALVDEGMAAISRGAHCDEDHLVLAEGLLAATGRVIRVPEKQQDAVTAVSGSGPAYIFFVVESMIEAGVHMGLPRSTATELVVQTVVGSAKLLRETGEHPTVLRERVTSPGGTTAAAVRELEDHKVRAAARQHPSDGRRGGSGPAGPPAMAPGYPGGSDGPGSDGGVRVLRRARLGRRRDGHRSGQQGRGGDSPVPGLVGRVRAGRNGFLGDAAGRLAVPRRRADRPGHRRKGVAGAVTAFLPARDVTTLGVVGLRDLRPAESGTTLRVMTRNGQVAILGAGVMGETLLSGLLRAGRRPGELLITERREERAAELRERYGVDVVTNLDAATKADTLVLVVKPQDMADLLAEIAPAVRAEQTVVSLAAGITTGFIESGCPPGRGGPGDAEHPGAGGRGDGRDLPRRALRRGPSGPGRGPAGGDRQGDPGPREAAGRGHGGLRFRSGVHLLRGRVDDRGRGAHGPAAVDGDGTGRADRGGLRQAAARDR
jgi:pyrroline-5-carboxylate reductase